MDKPTFIEIGQTDNTWTAVDQMRNHAHNQGGPLATQINTIPQAQPQNAATTLDEWEQLENAYHQHTPAGYRFVNHFENTKYGYTLVTWDH